MDIDTDLPAYMIIAVGPPASRGIVVGLPAHTIVALMSASKWSMAVIVTRLMV